MCLSINSVPMKHTVALSADNAFIGNFGMWQGPLSTGTHKLALNIFTIHCVYSFSVEKR